MSGSADNSEIYIQHLLNVGYMSKINYWTPKTITRDLGRYFNHVEFLTIDKFLKGNLPLNRKQKFVATLLNIPVLKNLGKIAINKFAHIEVVGIK